MKKMAMSCITLSPLLMLMEKCWAFIGRPTYQMIIIIKKSFISPWQHWFQDLGYSLCQDWYWYLLGSMVPWNSEMSCIKWSRVTLYPTAIGSEPILIQTVVVTGNVLCKGTQHNIVPVIAVNRYGLEEVTLVRKMVDKVPVLTSTVPPLWQMKQELF